MRFENVLHDLQHLNFARGWMDDFKEPLDPHTNPVQMTNVLIIDTAASSDVLLNKEVGIRRWGDCLGRTHANASYVDRSSGVG
jgi:hypothetical protein